jgi:hypothetical protein
MVAAGLLIGAGLLVAAQVRQRSEQIRAAAAEAQPWTISGPPCPLTKDVAPASRLAPVRTREITFNGVRFVRQFGHVECSVFGAPEGGLSYRSLCQFTGPAALDVQVHGRLYSYQPGIGQPATVFVEGDKVSCVLGVNIPTVPKSYGRR